MNSKNWATRFIAIMTLLVIVFVWFSGSQAKEKQEIKHIILFIGDGMHLEHERATSRYLYGKDFDLSWHKFQYSVPVATWDVTTYNRYAAVSGEPSYQPMTIDPSVGYDVRRGGKRPFPLDKNIDDDYFLKPTTFATDSASAGTAITTGYKTDDGNIAWLPSDPPAGKLKTIAEMLRGQKGFSIGVVSTVPFTHATPAAFVSHNISRNNYFQIADEIIRDIKPEVVIGGGHPKWDNRFMPASLYNDVKANPSSFGYVFVERVENQNGAENLRKAAQQAIGSNKKLFGLYGGRGGHFEPPVPTDSPGSPEVTSATIENPLLRDATIAALEVLSRDIDGFFLMVEQGDIDWANHANNYKWMIGTVWDLEEAVKAAVAFVDRPGDNIDWNNTILIVTSDHANSYMRLTGEPALGIGDLPQQIGRDYAWQYPDGEVTYSTNNHTNELVMLYSIGGKANKLFKSYEGEWYPCTRIIDNTHIFNVLAEATDIPDRSPLKVTLKKPSFCSKISLN